MTMRMMCLRLVHVESEDVLEEVDTLLDPEDGGKEYEEALGRFFLRMAARAANQRVRDDVADMPWLHDYRLDVCEVRNDRDVVQQFRLG